VIRKTEGIVLRTLRHQDANLITSVYTREFGLKSFIVKGFRSPRARKRHSFFQPLSLVELVIYHNEQRNLHSISESRIVIPFQQVQTHPVKLCLGLTALEVFVTCVKEEEQNEALYDFLREFITDLEGRSEHLIHSLLYYLVHLTGFLGFFPQDETEGSGHCEFELRQGLLLPVTEPDEVGRVLREFMYTEIGTCHEIRFGQDTKRVLIRRLLEYYQHHSEGFRWPQSIGVFEELFL
jgi:DNA repair protein RecO (recombination protein O)